MAKHEMKKNGTPQYILDNLDSFWETDDEEVLAARKVFKELYDKYKVQTDENAKKVIEAGGLFIVGTERHESRRIDNQLRGRSGRQGDPGMSRFYVSVQDDLMVRFGAEHMEALFAKLGDTVIESKTVTRSISGAQRRVEGVNYDARKQLLPVSYTHLRAHETTLHLVCRLLLEKKKMN